MIIALAVMAYFGLLLVAARFGGRGNGAFFRGGRKSPWPVVAFGMIGASLSGVTFISVPGMVAATGMSYLQMCMGFFFGYLLVAFVLIPLYYRHNLTSIYGYLETRFGGVSRKTGASFFLLSKLTGAAARMYLVCMVLQMYVFDAVGLPFVATVGITLLIIWLYTRRGGVGTIVWTDALQTLCMLVALVVILFQTCRLLDFGFLEGLAAVWADPHSDIFVWGDWGSTQHFVKMFLSGVFIVVVMTGLDQDMMQKNLTCRNQRDAQKNLCSYGALFLPVNFLFMSLGVLLLMVYSRQGIPLPATGDALLPGLIADGVLGQVALACFAIGIVASSFSSADSATTALTTSFCLDILEIERAGARFGTDPEKTRKYVHAAMILAFVVFILGFKAVGSSSVIDAIYVIAGYTYGPLLGLFAFGMLSKRRVMDRAVPLVALLSPLLCFLIDSVTLSYTGYKFGYEMLLFNGLITAVGLRAFSTAPAPLPAKELVT